MVKISCNIDVRLVPSFHRLHFKIQHNLWRMSEDCFGRICQCAYNLILLIITLLNNPIVFVYIYNHKTMFCDINVHNGCVCYPLFSVCGASQARNALTIQWRAFYHLIVFVLSQTHDGECAGVRLTVTYSKKHFVICLLS